MSQQEKRTIYVLSTPGPEPDRTPRSYRCIIEKADRTPRSYRCVIEKADRTPLEVRTWKVETPPGTTFHPVWPQPAKPAEAKVFDPLLDEGEGQTTGQQEHEV